MAIEPAELNSFLLASREAAKIGGRELLKWRGAFSVRAKSPADLVTEADLASQELIQRRLVDEFPNFGFIGEETAATVSSPSTDEYCWIVDPLDGTTNYVHGFPHFCVSIGLTYRGQPVVGTIYDPLNEECFSAARGGGATLNNHPICTSGTERLDRALLAASFPPQVTRASEEVEYFLRALQHGRTIRRTGSAALNLAYVAAGRLDGFWSTTLKKWDVAAGVVLIGEAGGILSNFRGDPFSLDAPDFVAAASVSLHADLLELFGGARRDEASN